MARFPVRFLDVLDVLQAISLYLTLQIIIIIIIIIIMKYFSFEIRLTFCFLFFVFFFSVPLWQPIVHCLKQWDV